ncbi:MAG: hypothetical protein LBS01_11885 [Prevotellaceae bacterium]|jgi:hypothetical protein|nr:hypothetical protein [Prevotellaceae bacterium]
MKNSKIIIIISLVVTMLFPSCAEQTGALYENLSNEILVSFQSAKYVAELTPADGTEIVVQLTRNKADGEFDVPVVFESSSDLFSLEKSTFHFNSGEFVASSKILFPGADNLGIGASYTLKLKLAVDTLVSEGGILTQTFTLSRKLTWIAKGQGQWTDGIVCAIFTVPAETYGVEVLEAEESPGLYKLINPYGLGIYPYTEAADVTRDPASLVIVAGDPDNVVVLGDAVGAGFGIGINYGYGEIFIDALGSGNKSGNTITFPAQTLATGMADYNGGVLAFYCKECKLVLP